MRLNWDQKVNGTWDIVPLQYDYSQMSMHKQITHFSEFLRLLESLYSTGEFGAIDNFGPSFRTVSVWLKK